MERKYFPEVLRSPINCGAFAMLGGMIIVPLVSLISRAPDRSMTDGIFSCYDRRVSVPAKDALSADAPAAAATDSAAANAAAGA